MLKRIPMKNESLYHTVRITRKVHAKLKKLSFKNEQTLQAQIEETLKKGLQR